MSGALILGASWPVTIGYIAFFAHQTENWKKAEFVSIDNFTESAILRYCYYNPISFSPRTLGLSEKKSHYYYFYTNIQLLIKHTGKYGVTIWSTQWHMREELYWLISVFDVYSRVKATFKGKWIWRVIRVKIKNANFSLPLLSNSNSCRTIN